MQKDFDEDIASEPAIKKMKKTTIIRDDDYDIPYISEYNIFIKNNYPVSFLKKICKYYNLKVSGNKPDLRERISNYLYTSNYAIIIQKFTRGFFARLYCKLIGPALYNRSLCTNTSDFLTFEKINDIPLNEFFSYYYDNNIWGFNILSIYNLFSKAPIDGAINPYTRDKLDDKLFNQIKTLVLLNKIFNTPVNIILNEEDAYISSKKRIEIKCLELFQYINELGNYSDHMWLLSLNRIMLLRFVRELIDIWEYRAQLTMEIKKEICHPYGNPFRYVDVTHLNHFSYKGLQKNVLSIIEQFIKKGITRDSQNLGASYILCALTLVNVDAAFAMPWLYQSVSGTI